MKKTKTKRELALKIEKLQARIDRAAQTLQAIRSGNVYAPVVSGLQSEQLFSLTGAMPRFYPKTGGTIK